MINIEMKHNYGGKLEQKLLEFLQKRNWLEHVVVSSFHHKYLQRLKKMAPELKIGLLYAANFLDHRTLVIGVSGIITNFPSRLHKLLNSNK